MNNRFLILAVILAANAHPQSGTSVGNSVGGIDIQPGSTLHLNIGNSANSGATFGDVPQDDGKKYEKSGTHAVGDSSSDVSKPSVLDGGMNGVNQVTANDGNNITTGVSNQNITNINSPGRMDTVGQYSVQGREMPATVGNTTAGDNSHISNNVGSTFVDNKNQIDHRDVYNQNITNVFEAGHVGNGTIQKESMIQQFLSALTGVSGSVDSITINFNKGIGQASLTSDDGRLLKLSQVLVLCWVMILFV